ncbi:MAG: alpha/beta fold hydrolase [Woeseiaceae bacterium]|nr:alpha/beta fold hydrolase [Woeseiaceae bacterium]
MIRAVSCLVTLALLAGCAERDAETVVAATLPPPMTVAELRSHDFGMTLRDEGPLPAGASFDAILLAYEHSGLTLRAMLAIPKEPAPADGFPLVIANHGYVPDPRKYGITQEGVDSRPGDYYRSVPELFASRGFLVVVPDYRGHNSSDGFEFIDPQDERSASYYAEDVVALMAALGDLESADTDNVFMWSHSMGGSVSMRALLATDIVRASSFWSTMNVDELLDEVDALGPVIVQHAVADASTPYSNSVSLAAALDAAGRLHAFHSYDNADHYFTGADRELAADRDAALFLSLMHWETELE